MKSSESVKKIYEAYLFMGKLKAKEAVSNVIFHVLFDMEENGEAFHQRKF